MILIKINSNKFRYNGKDIKKSEIKGKLLQEIGDDWINLPLLMDSGCTLKELLDLNCFKLKDLRYIYEEGLISKDPKISREHIKILYKVGGIDRWLANFIIGSKYTRKLLAKETRKNYSIEDLKKMGWDSQKLKYYGLITEKEYRKEVRLEVRAMGF